ncbi:MAG: 23S rRNA (uracil(1939)-C(5))-methyltransferase RlmD [Clostridiales bacterium]|jgi:23S rRNA (uracil1939-C5)-methyltransferase|nr:23S rRNA (uracil(1939)-C(5))-methyltransferase RlmD [Clostridiales bacterium]
MDKNDICTITIDDLNSYGEGIGHVDGMAVFVRNTLPGELAAVLIISLKKTYAYGKLLRIINPSPHRVSAACPIFTQCGGCDLMHCDYETQLNYKQKKTAEALGRIGSFHTPNVQKALGMIDYTGYRNKAIFPIDKDGIVGMYARKSHRVVETLTCHTVPTVTPQVLDIIRKYIRQSKVPVYDELTHKGLLRYVMTRVSNSTGEVMVCLVINGRHLPQRDSLINMLRDISGFSTLTLSHNTKPGNLILSEKISVLYGKGLIRDYIGDIGYDISSLSFFQINTLQAKVLYDTILKLADITSDETVLDMYCGAGGIALYLAKHTHNIIVGVEISKSAVDDAKKNAELNNIDNFQIHKADASKWLKENHPNADIIILDPPRKGCEKSVLDQVLNVHPKKIIYVSCDPASLARDAKYLCQNGYNLLNAQPIDMFPLTNHVETVALLTL